MRSVNATGIAEMYKRMRNDSFEEIAIFANLLFDLCSIVERPLVSMGMKLNIDACLGEFAKLVFV
jgi:hypothetical protein